MSRASMSRQCRPKCTSAMESYFGIVCVAKLSSQSAVCVNLLPNCDARRFLGCWRPAAEPVFRRVGRAFRCGFFFNSRTRDILPLHPRQMGGAT